MAVTVKPIQTVNVRVAGTPRPVVSSTTTFVGGQVNDVANTALVLANSAYQHANSAYDEANTAYGLANTAVQRAGDTMTGSLIVNANVYTTGTFFGTVDGGMF